MGISCMFAIISLFATTSTPVLGQDWITLYTFTGEIAGDVLGTCAGAGDVNGDGFEDVIVGAYSNDAGGVDAGLVYVFSGLDGDTLFVVTGEKAGDWLGVCVSSAGDVNCDGCDDFIISAQHAKENYSGKVYLFYGCTAPFPRKLNASEANHIFSGVIERDWFGNPASCAGDVNNDGCDDLIVGCSGNMGKAYVFSGIDYDTLYSYAGTVTDARLGLAVSGAGDFNGDGFADYAMHTYGHAVGSKSGQVGIFSGETGDTLMIIDGESSYDCFGSDISAAGDFNNDGYPDIIIGAYTWGSGDGRAYIVLGGSGPYPRHISASDADIIITGEDPGDWFGWVSGAGDVDCDEYDDVIVGAYLNDAGGADAGRAYIVRGNAGPFPMSIIVRGNAGPFPMSINAADAFQIFTGEALNDQFGQYVSSGIINADNCGDVIIAARLNDEEGTDAGKVYVFSYCADTDHDNICATEDNCPDVYNPDQEDADRDAVGDVCDNCVDAWNPTQGDSNDDGIGDACQTNDWRVEIETVETYSGCPNVTVSFKLYWAEPLSAVTIPLVVDTIDWGSFWTPPLPYDSTNLYKIPYQGIEGCATPGNEYDGVPPDNFIIQAHGTNPLAPQPDGWTFLTLEFGVTEQEGWFLFDTACATYDLNTIIMVDESYVDHGPNGTGDVTFKPGVVKIGPCDCTNHCDLDTNWLMNPVDVVIIVNYVYKGIDSRAQNQMCPGRPGDWNCDGFVNPVDVVYYVNCVYKNQCTGPCDPCECDPYPGNCPPLY